MKTSMTKYANLTNVECPVENLNDLNCSWDDLESYRLQNAPFYFYKQIRWNKPGGHSHVKAYGDVPPKWVTFSLKILRHGCHFGQKNP